MRLLWGTTRSSTVYGRPQEFHPAHVGAVVVLLGYFVARKKSSIWDV